MTESRLAQHLVVLLLLYVEFSSTESKSGLCEHCKCTPSQENETITDVDCTDKIMTYPVLFHESSWFDDANVSYPYGKVILQSSEIGDLSFPFFFSNLNYLDLSKNFIRKINSSCFAQLQNMNTLILSDNNIDQLHPDVFKGLRMDGENYPLRSLRTLKLDNNNLHTLDDDLFEHLEQVLEVLDLSYNPLKVIDLQTTIAIGSIIYLKELYLRFTQLRTLPDHFLHTPRHLKLLDISGNDFRTIPEGLSEVHVLETLYFNNNPIVNITAETGFPNITTLKVVYLCYNIELVSIGARAFSKLEHLTELHICNNMKLSHIDPAALSRIEVENEIWPPLKKLYLDDNQLATIDFHLVLNWNHLEDLDLRFNPWTCECENQWFVDTLMPIYIDINEERAKEIKCGAPIEMDGFTFYQEYKGNKSMRCLDAFGNRPERDGTILIGVLIGLLIGIPFVLFIIFAYQRNWFGLFDKSPAAYSRQFYRRTRSEEL